MNSQITSVPSGFVNDVNLAAIGMPTALSVTGTSLFSGQLGKTFWLDADTVRYSTVSPRQVVGGGRFRWVRLASGAGSPIVGQVLFWDTLANAAEDLFQVTTAESGSTDAAMFIAGVNLTPSVTAGNYTLIQDVGIVFTKFRAALTAAGAVGSRAFAAAAGGADLGFADVIDSANPTLFSDVSKMLGRYLGVASDAPTSGGVKRVNLQFHNIRG